VSELRPSADLEKPKRLLRDPAELIVSVRRGLSCAGGWPRIIRLPGGAKPLTAARVTAGPLPPP
jgi:hypothetical protein